MAFKVLHLMVLLGRHVDILVNDALGTADSVLFLPLESSVYFADIHVMVILVVAHTLEQRPLFLKCICRDVERWRAQFCSHRRLAWRVLRQVDFSIGDAPLRRATKPLHLFFFGLGRQDPVHGIS